MVQFDYGRALATHQRTETAEAAAARFEREWKQQRLRDLSEGRS